MSDESKIDRFAADLRAQINHGDFGPRGRIPSVKQLSERWGTTRSTVSDVLQLLQSEGLIRRIDKKSIKRLGGELIVSWPTLSLEGITENFERFLRSQGYQVTMENLIDPIIEPMPKD